eukprot:g1608.t1
MEPAEAASECADSEEIRLFHASAGNGQWPEPFPRNGETRLSIQLYLLVFQALRGLGRPSRSLSSQGA